MRLAQWWDPADEALGEPTLDDLARRIRIRDLLSDSVALRMRSDVAYGAFLSGGIDSSAVVGLMSGVASQPVSTFSVTFAEKELGRKHVVTACGETVWDGPPRDPLDAGRFPR